ncbi:MAG: hypothetical protein HWE21_02130, partial [Cytophagia bacterium]|nr:hypothetical protein [Cytophagia bacterium]
MKLRSLILYISTLAIISSCSVSRFVPEDKYLLKSADVELISEEKRNDLGSVEGELSEIMKPQPNSKLLGMRLGLLYHYKAQRVKPGFLIKYLNKKFGEEPVYLSDFDSLRAIDLMDNRLENNGFFHPNISSGIELKKHFASLDFKINLDQPYELEKYELDSANSNIHTDIRASLEDTYFTKGTRFNLELMKDERGRIDTYLKSKGYYNFHE